METMTLTPKENGTAAASILSQVIAGTLQPTQDVVINLPGVLLPANCEQTAAIFADQYGLNADYTALDCSQYN